MPYVKECYKIGLPPMLSTVITFTIRHSDSSLFHLISPGIDRVKTDRLPLSCLFRFIQAYLIGLFVVLGFVAKLASEDVCVQVVPRVLVDKMLLLKLNILFTKQ